MTVWAPCALRIVQPVRQDAFRMRGVQQDVTIWWPDALLNGGAEYGVDFSSALCCEDILTAVSFEVPGGALGWSGQPTFTQTAAVAFITWTQPGEKTVRVSARTSRGASLTVSVHIRVADAETLLPTRPPDAAPNVLTDPSFAPLTLPDGAQLLAH